MDKLFSLPRERDEVMAPVHIRIKPTNVCAHKCWYCAYRSDDLQLGQDMASRDEIPRDKMLEIIDDCIAMGVKAITFSGGGDPFYYPHLLEATTRLADSEIRFASLTNGAKLQGELARLFARHATWLRISIDGWDEASYGAYRGVSGREFTKVMRNMAAFKELDGGCVLGVSLVVDRRNADHVGEMLERFKAIGVDSVKVGACIVSNSGAECDAYHEPIFARVKAQIRAAQESLGDGGFEIYDAYHAMGDDFGKEYDWCPYLQILPVIAADLNVYSCQDKAYNLDSGVLGSIRERRFRDLWFDGKEKFFAIDPRRDCNHHCVAHQKNRLIHGLHGLDPEHLPFV